jgi:sugar transferase (PEP-CTERM/EpsH1 system associated)
MSGILFLAHRPPFPPDRGDKIRSHHVLKALAELAPVHVGCLADNAADAAHGAELRGIAASSFVAMRTKPLPLAGAEALAGGLPVSLTAFRHAALSAWVRQTLERGAIDTIYVFSGQMGQYVPAGWNGRLLVDLVDVDSAKFEAYAEGKRGLRRWIDRREGRLLRAEEARLVARADATLLVSQPEAELLAGRLGPGSAARIEVLGNGIDTARYDPARVEPHPALSGGGPQIVFTGQMDYPPNVEAARRLIERLMPRILAAEPEARLHIVGRAPVPELRALHGINGARMWGEVPDVRPFLAAASLVAAPLTIARGVQNKVLEAMAMARPVVLTQAAATGIPGEDGTHFALADSDDAFVTRTLELLASDEAARRMGAAARRLVSERMSWPAMLAGLPALVGREGKKARRDAA